MSFSDREARRAFGIMVNAWRHGEPAQRGITALSKPSLRRAGARWCRRVALDDRRPEGNLERLREGGGK